MLRADSASLPPAAALNAPVPAGRSAVPGAVGRLPSGGPVTPLWPAILVSILTGMGFAGLKFVLIGEIALDFAPDTHVPLRIGWLEEIIQHAYHLNILREAITQGLAALLTGGVLFGYLINSPLAGAWRVPWLFVISSAGMAAGTLLSVPFNPWLVAGLVGVAYGAACAARGKVIPLLAAQSGRSSTQVSGYINASLVISLLAGTLFGTLLYDHLPSPWQRHGVLFVFLLIATVLGFLVNPQEPPPIPFRTGLRDIVSGTTRMLHDRWPYLVGGGIAWGIASASVLAAFMHAIVTLRLSPDHAVSLVVFPALGAILGNLLSHRMHRRLQVIASYAALAALIAFYPLLVRGVWSGAGVMTLIGICFSAPTNVLDARLLSFAAAQGTPGRGSTVMSLVHNICILVIGSSLAICLFLGGMDSVAQFHYLGVLCLVTAAVASQARIEDPGDGSGSVIRASTVLAPLQRS
jgi:MFS family permease